MSGLEMSQNSMRLQWSREEVDAKLKVPFPPATCLLLHLQFASV